MDNPRPTPLDILNSKDEASALKDAYEMVVIYREIAQASLAHAERLTDQNRRLRERLRQVLGA